MSETTNPRQVVERLLGGIADGKWLELHELYADDAVIDYPFGLPAPTKLKGRAEIQRYFAAVAGYPLTLQPRDVRIHETRDPEVVVIEWTYDGLVTNTGRRFEVANIQVSRVRDGRIVVSRDYHNHFTLAEMTGRLQRLVSAAIAKSGE